MRRSPLATLFLLSFSVLALGACGKGEVKTGNLTQRFSMVDDKGVLFGVVEMDPVSGGSITDVQGRVVGRIVPPVNATVAQAMPAQMPVIQ
ncbi:MAG: hypothetical protein K2X09_05150 [Rickettsiales bacterium]|nr:hypothetical protein [Rickettsiales bacterium]